MSNGRAGIVVLLCLVATMTTWGGGVPRTGEHDLHTAAIEAAKIELRTFHETKKARNDRLNEAFRGYLRSVDEETAGESVRRFHVILKKHGLSSFDDFQQAEMTPRREVTDASSGEAIPVLGPLGSDLINPWLADLEIVESKPLEEQPIYICAKNVLREHLDFALIGIADPNLSFDTLPGKLQENARQFYRRLNPTNRFDGGFDHPLFYATVRFAAKKLFREDYPHAKITMAELVVAEDRGGFGTRSCLLCHEGNHAGVYKRLLAQGLYLEVKSRELPAASREAAELKASSANYHLAAKHVLDAHADRIDAEAVRRSLAMNSPDNYERLKPGYDVFYGVLGKNGCLKCHSTEAQPPQGKNPREFGAWVLHPSSYHKTENIKRLLETIDTTAVDRSPLLLKATGRNDHEGAETVKLDGAGAAELRDALTRWLTTF